MTQVHSVTDIHQGSAGVAVFGPTPNLVVKQTRKGCLRTMMGCDAKNEFLISTQENPNLNHLFAVEESGCFCRTFFAAVHPFDINLFTGGGPGGQQVAQYKRPRKT
jgi:hypothetical protein